MGLLVVRPATLGFSDSFKLARAFNCYKAPNRDRMIIDRRGQNWAESRLSGPSMLEVCPKRQTVLCAAADRKDFYHQIHAPLPKALCNALGPALASMKHTQAFAAVGFMMLKVQTFPDKSAYVSLAAAGVAATKEQSSERRAINWGIEAARVNERKLANRGTEVQMPAQMGD